MNRVRTNPLTAGALCALGLLTPSLCAQQTKVLPGAAAAVEGNSSCYFPFLYDASRAQVIWQARSVSVGTAVLNSLAFRRDTTPAGYPARSVAAHVASLGPTSVAPSAMSNTYSANITMRMTTLFTGTFNIAALPAPNPGPAPFAIRYPLSTPFIYTPAQGNLLLDWTTGTGPATQKTDYQLDAVTAQASGGYGFVRPFGSWGKFAGGDQPGWKADASTLVPGGTAALTLGGLRQGYPASLIVGLSDTTYNGLNLPFDLGVLGAPGNTLYASMNVVAPFALQQSTSGYGANLSFGLPKDDRTIGLSVFVQSYYADARSNALGLVASDAMELTIGSAGPIGNMVAGDGANNATGSPTGFLPVVEFAGAIK